mmetsp:Transcript_7750/g.16592  ORF Transcript_7750/g.16592 Transcript_7750/m.16592 type:complete len:289 (-) Transcript_7750:41-907(-)
MMAYKTNIYEIISRIEAMRSLEGNTKRSHDYFLRSHPVNEQSRKAMIKWCNTVADTLSLRHETVSIAFSYLDRYLSSGNGNSSQVLENRHKFQLAAVACYYIAVKLHESAQVGVNLFVKLCRNVYSAEDILSMEKEILFYLDWKVSGPTPLDFARYLLELLPGSVQSSHAEYILQNAEKHLEYATSEMFFSSYNPSIVGVGCIISALKDTEVLSSEEQHLFLEHSSKALALDFRSPEVIEVRRRMLSPSTPRGKVSMVESRKMSVSNSSLSNYTSGSSSPVCVSQTTS